MLLALGCEPQLPPGRPELDRRHHLGDLGRARERRFLNEVFATFYPFYIGFHEVEDNQATSLLVIGNDDGQDFCSRTVRMNNITINKDLSFSYGPEDFTVANGFRTESLKFPARSARTSTPSARTSTPSAISALPAT